MKKIFISIICFIIVLGHSFSQGKYGGGMGSGNSSISLSGFVLPIELLSFSAEKSNGNKIRVFWETNDEMNNDYFIVEKSIDNVDWVNIGKVNGHGNSNTNLNYEFIDNHPNIGISYYRLKHYGLDVVFGVSQIVSISFEVDDMLEIVDVFPNPISNDVLYISTINARSPILLYNNNGKLIKKIPPKERSINFSYLSKGVYFLKVNQRFIKVVFN